MVHFPLFYFSNNLFDLSPTSFVELLAITFSFGFAIVGISIGITKIIKKPTNPIFIIVNIFLFFSYGIFFESLSKNVIEINHFYIIPIFFAVFFIFLKYAPKFSIKLAKVVFTILFVFIIIDVITLFSEYEFNNNEKYWAQSNDTNIFNLEGLPNIIFIIPDEYPSKSWLLEHVNYDNSMFLKKLEMMGFDIGDTHSNYMMTNHSISSTFNMNYVVHTDQNFEYTNEISQSTFLKLLRQNGYELIQINGAGNEYLEDFDINLCSPNKIWTHQEFYKQTIIFPIVEKLVLDNKVDNRMCFFNELLKIENLENKKRFVYAHILMPHSPYYTEDENGNLIDLKRDNDGIELLGNNIDIINDKLINMMPEIIENNPNTIIIIMSDHGYRSDFNVTSKQMFENLFVVYLPEDYELEEIKSNVNIFRSIIRNVDKNMQLLNDEFFLSCFGEIIKIPEDKEYRIECWAP